MCLPCVWPVWQIASPLSTAFLRKFERICIHTIDGFQAFLCPCRLTLATISSNWCSFRNLSGRIMLLSDRGRSRVRSAINLDPPLEQLAVGCNNAHAADEGPSAVRGKGIVRFKRLGGSDEAGMGPISVQSRPSLYFASDLRCITMIVLRGAAGRATGFPGESSSPPSSML